MPTSTIVTFLASLTVLLSGLLSQLTSLTPSPINQVAQVTSSNASSLPLLQRGDFTYLGAFKLPEVPRPEYAYGFESGGQGLAYNPANNSLFLTTYVFDHKVGEVSIVNPVNSTSLAALPKATLLQGPKDITEGNFENIGTNGTWCCTERDYYGGLMVYKDKLYGTVYPYFNQEENVTRSHFSSSLNLSSLGDFSGMHSLQTGLSPGFVSGYMTPVPTEWQSLLGGTALTGNCCLTIISRTSIGPAITSFNPENLGPSTPANPLVYYTLSYPTLGMWGGSTQWGVNGVLINGGQNYTGLVFPNGTRSIIAIGSGGIGPYCYGPGTTDLALAGQPVPGTNGSEYYCYDLVSFDKGNHAYPYKPMIMIYDANDLAAVKAGTKNPWDVRPYTYWTFDLPFTAGLRFSISGAAYDPATKRLYILGGEDNEYLYREKPVVYVYQLNIAGGGTSDTIPPTVSLTSPTNGSSMSGTVTLFAVASDNTGVSGVQFKVDGVNIGAEDTTSPYSVSLNTTTLSNASHTISATARDAAGNIATASVTVTVNNSATCPTITPPTCSYGTPTATYDSNQCVTGYTCPNPPTTNKFIIGDSVQNTTTVNVRETANSHILGTQPTGAIGVIIGGPVYSGGYQWWQVDYGTGVDGWAAEDYLVKYNPSEPSDTTPPLVSLTSPSGTVSGTVSVSATASDNTGVSGVQFKVDGVNIGAEDTTSPYSVSLNTTTLSNASHTISATARDAAGNIATASVTVTVNNSATCPTIIPPTCSYGTPTPEYDSNQCIINYTCPNPPISTKFVIGDSVQTTANVNVRSTSSATGTLLGTQSTGATGTVVGGSIYADGYYWWQIDYTSGADGWSTENYLVKTVINPNPTDKFIIGDPVVTTSKLNVRSTAGGRRLGSQNRGATGVVVDGPASAQGYTWWRVDFTNAPDGWVVQDYVNKR